MLRLSVVIPLIGLALFSSCLLKAADPAAGLHPSFPNYAAITAPPITARDAVAPRLNPTGPVDTDLPFSWDQTVVVHAGDTNLRVIGGFDPQFQPVQINLLPSTPQFLKIQGYDPLHNVLGTSILDTSAGNIESLPFQVVAREITNPQIYNLNFDIRERGTKIRGTPILTRSPGDFIRPGQIVRYTWTQTGSGEKRPKTEAFLVGRTGTAAQLGITSSTVTEILSVKFQPFVLGHYLMTATPRDVRGEPPRGSTSNGQVFRCAFGDTNLAPVPDGFSADTFTPTIGQTITLQPNIVDPETGQSVFDNEVFDFGDGTVVSGLSGATTHAYSVPGIYHVACTVMDNQGLGGTSDDNIIVGAFTVQKIAFKFTKMITPDESGVGDINSDSLSVRFSNIGAAAGDRIVFVYNRNRFGRTSASDSGDDTDIIIKGGQFSGTTRLAKNITVQATGSSITISMNHAQFDRTGDPRFGRADLKGIFTNQRIAVCVIPADGTTPRVQAYLGNVQIKTKGGDVNRVNYVPELSISGTATTKLPDPKKQEIPQ